MRTTEAMGRRVCCTTSLSEERNDRKEGRSNIRREPFFIHFYRGQRTAKKVLSISGQIRYFQQKDKKDMSPKYVENVYNVFHCLSMRKEGKKSLLASWHLYTIQKNKHCYTFVKNNISHIANPICASNEHNSHPVSRENL
jgi:hypothetical protein